MSGSSVRMVAVAVVAVLVGGLVGCGDRSSSTLVTSLPTTTTAEEAPAEVTEPSSTTVEPDPTTTTTSVEPDPVQDPTTTVAEEAPAEVTEPSTTTTSVEPDPGPSSTTTVEPEPVSPTTTTTTSVEPDPVQDPTTTTSVVSDPVQDPTTTTSVVSDPVQDPTTTTTSVVSDPGPGPSTTIVEPEPVSPTTTVDPGPGLVGVGNEFSGEPVSEVGGDETLDFVEVARLPAGWDGRLPEPVGERLPLVLPKDDGWAPPDIRPENWDRRKREDGAWMSEVVDLRVGTVREPPPYSWGVNPSVEEQASYDSAYQIVVAMDPVLPSDVGIGSKWYIYWCDVNPWWFRQEFPDVVNGYLFLASAYKVEGGFRESSSGAGIGPDC